jgi:multidrug efflux system membrane fusion protein
VLIVEDRIVRHALLYLCLALPAAAHAADAPRPVRVATVVFTQPVRAEIFSGAVQAHVQADLAFRVGGKVTERLVNAGDHVRAGQVLARLDPSDLQLSLRADESAVRAADAEAAEAAAELARYRNLGSNSAAYLAAEFDRRRFAASNATARAEQARRQLSLAQDQLAYGDLKADADGVITALPVQVGQVVQPGQTTVQLAHTAETEVVVDVPEDRLALIRGARDVSVSLWSAPDRVIAARVREIGALADPVSRTFSVKVALPADAGLSLGMTASVRFAMPEGNPVALLPGASLVDRDGTPAVWVLQGASHAAATHAVKCPVKLAGFRTDGSVALLSGLSPGDQVVTAGASLLRADMQVTPWAGAAR